MIKIILDVDGSEPSLAATRAVIKHRPMFVEPVEIHLIHVAAPIPRPYGTHLVVDSATIARIIKDDAEQAMMSSKILFDKWGIAYQSQHIVASRADAPCAYPGSSHKLPACLNHWKTCSAPSADLPRWSRRRLTRF